MIRALSFLAAVLSAGVLFAADPGDPLDLVPSALRTTLVSQGEVSEFADRYGSLTLAQGSPLEPSMADRMQGRPSTLAAEAFFWIPLPSNWTAPASNARLFKALTSVSTMRNLQVYSESLHRMETFIFDAYRVGSLTKADRLGDPVPTGELSTTFLLFENEEQTGEGFSQYSFSQEPDRFVVTLTNLSSLNYGPFPLVSPRDLLTCVYFVPGKDHILVYGATVAQTFSLFGLERTRTASLFNRMKALVTWFGNNLKDHP